MAFTEAALNTQLDAVAGGRTIVVQDFVQNANGLQTDMYCVGVLHPYAGRSRWVSVAQSNTAAQAATAIQTALQA